MSRISNSGTKSSGSSNRGNSKRSSKKNSRGRSGNSNRKFYVAYGSNLLVPQMSYRCQDAEVIGTGKIMDYKLVFRYHADIEPNPDSYVPVLIWKISESDEKQLDMYEGVKVNYYHQEEVTVVMDEKTDNNSNNDSNCTEATEDTEGIDTVGNDGNNSKELVAMVYIMNSQDHVFPPDDVYYQIIEDGYTQLGFDKEILKKALNESIEGEKNG